MPFYGAQENEYHLGEDDVRPIGGFYCRDDLNSNWYSPFLPSKKEYRTISSDKIAEFLTEEEKNGWYFWEGVGGNYAMVAREVKEESRAEIVPLPAGVYSYEPHLSSDCPERLVVFSTSREEEILEIGGTFTSVKEDITRFLGKREVFTEINTPYKLGILLYGSPGQGKTILISKLVRDLKDAVVIYMNPSAPVPSKLFLSKLSSLTSDQLKVFIFEELTTNLDQEYISWLLSFLDGPVSISNSITIATTNYPESLPENIINRPSRFDKLYEFDNPKAEERKILFAHFMGREATPEEIKDTGGLSVAGIKELCLLVRINDLTIPEAVARLKERATKCKKQFQKSSGNLGF